MARPRCAPKPRRLQTCFAEAERTTESSGQGTEVQAEPSSAGRKGLFLSPSRAFLFISTN